jgi:6-pyruvoyltetrahydropterin/6-carboxytetrahydropterin synthase
MRLTRRYRFSASHRLNSPRLSPGENDRVYGKCNNPFGHGHDYALEVSVSGPLDEETGRVVDLDKLDELVRREVIVPFEHRNLNQEVPAFAATVPTTENLAIEIRRRLEGAWGAAFAGQGTALAGIRIEETKRNSIQLNANETR